MPPIRLGRAYKFIEPDAAEQSVTEAVNNTLKAIAASLLMEQGLTLSSILFQTPDSGPKVV